MASFQGIVIIVAILLLIITLILIGLLMAKSKNTEQWPPLIGACPDYWMDTSGNGSNCVNVKDLGIPKCIERVGGHFTKDFSTDYYTGDQGLCNKYTWANTCGVSWDGITYGVPNPCTPPPPSS